MLGVNKSTISRELNRKMAKGMFCSTIKAIATCNVCRKKNYCSYHPKLYYDYKASNDKACDLRMTPRKKSHLSKEVIKEIDEAIAPLIYRGQSLHHIYASDARLRALCSERTLRRLVYRRELSVGPSSLRRYVRFPHHLPKKEKPLMIRDIRYIIGRKYSDYLNHVKTHRGINRIEYDSVIGKINDFQAILTITFVKYGFQFGLLIKKGDSSSVLKVLKNLYRSVGDKAKEIFAANLCDNGTEFAQFYEIERHVGKSFYATPYRSSDKPHCERAHELVRYVFPKGKSLNEITQEMLDEVFSNINSYIRKSKGDKTPYDLVRTKFGKAFLSAINIRRIPNKKVKLTQLI
jgi:IS30 family transposase